MSELSKKTPTTYISILEASEKWKIHQSKISKMCEDGLIDGAAKLDEKWIIPWDSEKPVTERNTTLVRPVIAKNKVQEAALEHIENSDYFHTREMVVDGKTFIVSSIFQKQGKTAEEHWAYCVLSRLEKFENIHLDHKEREELMMELRKSSAAANMTFDKFIEYYRKHFKEYGFSDADIEVLLERRALDYEKFEI